MLISYGKSCDFSIFLFVKNFLILLLNTKNVMLIGVFGAFVNEFFFINL